MQTQERYHELDALRGLAALVVFSYHCIFLLAVCPIWLLWLIRTPAGLVLYGGHQAVILFFILSGFVLYLPYDKGRQHLTYLAFAIKRVCRIYLPYLAALLFFIALYLLFFPAVQPLGLSNLYQWRALTMPQQIALFRDHVLFLGFYHREYWNGATWTLAEEMRISLIFPLLAGVVASIRGRFALLLALAGSLAVSVVIHLLHHRTPFEPFHYVSLFVLGAVLARNRHSLLRAWTRAGRAGQLLTVCAAVLCATYSLSWMTRFPALVTEEAADWIIALSVSVFLIAALAGTWLSRLLRVRWMQHLGRTSYGIYLLHLPILFAFASLLWNSVPPVIVFLLALLTTLALAHVFFVYVERPSMALGKRLARAVGRREQPLSTPATEIIPADGAAAITQAVVARAS